MNTRLFCFLSAVGVICGAGLVCAAEKSAFDIAPPDKRKALMETASYLAKQHAVEPLAAAKINPFDPSGFGQADADERAAVLAAAKAAHQTAATRAPNDRELLETIASKIVTYGTIITPSGEPVLSLGKKYVKIGTKFTVTYSGVDYPLELTAIDRTTFTLRYNREEIIRPINKAGK